MFFSLKLCL